MSFPEYLKERISEDYKNLIIQKLQEIKEQTEHLKTTAVPSIAQLQALRESVEQELARIQEFVRTQTSSLQERIAAEIQTAIEEYVSTWFHSDISAFEQQLEMLLSDIISNLPVPPKRPSSELESLVEFTRKMDGVHTQSEVLKTLLQHISNWVDRAVLFVVKGEQAVAWAGLGLSHDWDSGRIRQIKVNLSQATVLGGVVTSGQPSYGLADKYADNAELFMQIGSTFPRTALAFPVTVRGKIAGILYADLQEDLGDKPDLPNLLYLACRAAGFEIDVLPLKPKTVAPPEPAKTYPSSAGSAAPVMEEVREPGKEEGQATVIMPVPQVVPLSEEEQKLHDDAKRFARLLVSEIKLYNEAQVAAGRENRDLYERLRDDIERSRRTYMDRVPQHIFSSTDYFYEELVRTLANGDSSLLGM